ncbi:MarR family winged helix-turn-helix transcriptional regulator [Paenibacillus camelliae]|uniref:MarR family winged helix-turn-helix transcriptional regulator n=1 Tax=Paenibacillus camelliae TaxID=512410 RepID=UPI0020418D30|nr:MarR family transcriptional regulator [Paenibacillus camelliae]MCM3635531.1 MarR family transcriptional regulator [Paenibacillus camelliae]
MANERMTEIVERYERATYMINRRLSSKVKEGLPNDITPEQLFILRYLKRNNDVSSSELADLLCVGKSTITSVISRMVNKGYVVRTPSQEDRRVVYLSLTEEGDRQHSRIEETIYHIIEPYISKIGEAKAFEYIAVLEHISEVLMMDLE